MSHITTYSGEDFDPIHPDATKIHITDITRPVKPYLSNYIDIEERLQSLIYQNFISEPLSSEDSTQIKEIDELMLVCEFNDFTIVQI